MTIHILLCDTFPGLLPHYIPSYEWMFTSRFSEIEPQLTFKVFHAHERILPPHIEKGELYLITGSNSGAYENKPWIMELQEFIRKAHAQEALLSGVCFGHQLIAQALGGEVIRSPKGWGIGIRQSDVLTPAATEYFGGKEMRLLYNHHDQVVRLPAEAVRFATSTFCENEGFTIGKHILTFQGHPEYTVPYSKHLILNHAAHEDETVKANALLSMEQDNHLGVNAMRWMIDMMSAD